MKRLTSRLLRFSSFETLLTTVIFLAVFLACGLTPMQTDTWWQMRAGRDMWAMKQALQTDIYSHTAYGSYWMNHAWLAEVLFYLLHRAGGLPLLTVFAAAVITVAWGVTWRLTRATAREKALWVGLALIASAGWWEPRPHAFSLLFIPTTVLLIAHGRLWALPVVFLLWANLHGGVLLGLVLLGTGLGVRTLVEPQRWRQVALILLVCVIAVTLTPLGVSFWTEIPQSLGRINQYTLDEWKRPTLTEVVLLPFWGILGAFCWLLVRNLGRFRDMPARDAVIVACALVLAPGALSAVRNVGPFLMVAVPALSVLHVKRDGRRSRDEEHPVLNVVIMVAAVAAVAGTLTWAYRNQIPKLMWSPIPAGALNALDRCPGNLYNRYDEGGPLLWFAPERKVFLDGRQDPFPPELVLEHIAVETGRASHADAFRRHQITCAFLPLTSPVARALPAEGWKTLYRDGTWIVLAR